MGLVPWTPREGDSMFTCLSRLSSEFSLHLCSILFCYYDSLYLFPKGDKLKQTYVSLLFKAMHIATLKAAAGGCARQYQEGGS